MLDRGDDRYRDKEWRLITAEGLRPYIGLKVNEMVGMEWTPACTFVNLVINEKYKGVYYLIESVKRNPKCRINVSNTGYVVERDAYWWNEEIWFSSYFYSNLPSYRWTWKFPDENAISPEIELYIQNYINETEVSISRGDYDNYIDVESFASWLLAHDFLGTYDSGGSNLFVTKYDDRNSLLKMGNLWDFDSIFWKLQSFSRYHDEADFYFPALFSSPNSLFSQIYKMKWGELRDKLSNDLYDFVCSFSESIQGEALQKSRYYWNKELPTIEDELISLKDWIVGHTIFMDKEIIGTVGIDAIDKCKMMDDKENKGSIYDLKGCRVNDMRSGNIYILNRQKQINLRK